MAWKFCNSLCKRFALQNLCFSLKSVFSAYIKSMTTFVHPGSAPLKTKHLKKLQVGDCYMIEDQRVAYLALNVVYRAAKKLGIEITTRRTSEFGRCIWRDA